MNALIKLSESDRRVLIALCLVLIILLVLFGYLVKLIRYILKKKADFVDNSMYDLLDANVILNKKHFRKVSFEKTEENSILKPVFRFFPSALPVYDLHLSLRRGIQSRFHRLLHPRTGLQTGLVGIGRYPFRFYSRLRGMAEDRENAGFYFNRIEAWLTYLFDLGMLYGTVHFLLCSIFYLARNYRTLTLSSEYFKKDVHALKEAKLAAKGVHVKEPSEEMKKIIEKES